MQYRNGREAKTGDKIVQLSSYRNNMHIGVVGFLNEVKLGELFADITSIQSPAGGVCLVDCLHVDDVIELLKQAGLDKKPKSREGEPYP